MSPPCKYLMNIFSDTWTPPLLAESKILKIYSNLSPLFGEKVINLKRSLFGRVGSGALNTVNFSKIYSKYQWKHAIFRNIHKLRDKPWFSRLGKTSWLLEQLKKSNKFRNVAAKFCAFWHVDICKFSEQFWDNTILCNCFSSTVPLPTPLLRASEVRKFLIFYFKMHSKYLEWN